MADGKDKAKRRRGSGEGTVFHRADGYYCAQVDLGVDERTGKRSRPTKCFKLRKDAAAWLTKTLEEKRRGQIVLPSKGTVEHYLTQWAENDLAGHRPRVQYEYKRAIE